MPVENTRHTPYPEEPTAAGGRFGEESNGHDRPQDAFKQIGAQIAELRDYATYYVGAKWDGIKLTLRNVALYAALGIVGGIFGAAVLVTAAVMLLSGLAGALGALFGGRIWLGELIVSIVVLGGIGAATYFLLNRIIGTSRKKTIEKYEHARHQQQAHYGHDVHDRAVGKA